MSHQPGWNCSRVLGPWQSGRKNAAHKVGSLGQEHGSKALGLSKTSEGWHLSVSVSYDICASSLVEIANPRNKPQVSQCS